METKICGKCKQGKPLNEFYINRRDGYQSYCKECKKIGDRKYNKQPKRREFNKQCYEKLKNDGYFNEYQQKPEVKKRNAEQMKKYSQDPRLRIRFLARWFARRMTENGTIKQEPCAICGEKISQRHHPDYTKPLLIIWLCADCHNKIPKSKQEGK